MDIALGSRLRIRLKAMKKMAASIALKTVAREALHNCGVVVMDDSARVSGFQEKPKLGLVLEGDVIYVPKSGVANVGYVLRQLLPGLSFLSFGMTTAGGK